MNQIVTININWILTVKVISVNMFIFMCWLKFVGMVHFSWLYLRNFASLCNLLDVSSHILPYIAVYFGPTFNVSVHELSLTVQRGDGAARLSISSYR